MPPNRDQLPPQASCFAPVTLRGSHVALVPLSLEHEADLAEAVRDGELWKLWFTNAPAPEEIRSEIERRLELQQWGAMVPFAVVEPQSGRAVGMTCLMNIDTVNRRVEIGGTWYARRVQRTGLNTEAKLLLLAHCSRCWTVLPSSFWCTS